MYHARGKRKEDSAYLPRHYHFGTPAVTPSDPHHHFPTSVPSLDKHVTTPEQRDPAPSSQGSPAVQNGHIQVRKGTEPITVLKTRGVRERYPIHRSGQKLELVEGSGEKHCLSPSVAPLKVSRILSALSPTPMLAVIWKAFFPSSLGSIYHGVKYRGKFLDL